MALSASIVWEVRDTGSAVNGGGFKTGASGTDFSQQDAAQFALTGIATVGAGATFLTASAATTMVGNLLQVVSGTNFTVGIYEVTSVSAGVSVTVDRNICTGVGASGVINIGGALASLTTTVPVAGNITYIKGSFSLGAGITLSSPSDVSIISPIIGYSATRGDNGFAVFTAAANITMFTVSGFNIILRNIELDGASTTTVGLSTTAVYPGAHANLKIHHCNSGGVLAAGTLLNLNFCEVYNCGGTNGAIDAIQLQLNGCYVHDNTKTGIYCGNYATVNFCVSESNSGATSDGFNLGLASSSTNNIAYNNGRDGLRTTYPISVSVINCIFSGNTGYGINIPASSKVMPSVNNNAFYSNTAGARNTIAAGPNDVTLSGDPFVDAANGNFALNTTAGAGAACKAVGYPGAFPGGLSTGYASIGTIQPDPSSGGGGSLIGDGLVSVV